MRIRRSKHGRSRDAAVTAEFAILLPLLMFLFGIGVDFARAFYAHLIITNAARNAALYGSDNPTKASDTAAIEAVARKDTTDLGAEVVVQSSTSVDASGNRYLTVNITYPFRTVTGFPGVPSPLTINQKSVMQVQATEPRPGTY